MTGNRRRLTVDAGSIVLSNQRDEELATATPVGTGVLVCLTADSEGVAALLHFARPDSSSSPNEAAEQPARFADTGLTLLFEATERLGVPPSRCKVRLVGAANLPDQAGSDKVAKRNLLAARGADRKSVV